MKHIYVLRGLMGSGKTTYAREFIRNVELPAAWKYINKDSLRVMFDDGTYSKNNEKFIHETFMKLVAMALSSGFNVVCDNTHPTSDSVKPYHRLAASIGDVTVSTEWIRTSLDECLERNSRRSGSARVPDSAIIDLAKKIGVDRNPTYRHLKNETVVYPKKEIAPKPARNDDLPSAIICDLDGTLAHIGDRSPYDASRCDMLDSLNKAVANCLFAQKMYGHRIIFVTGREEKDREPTLRFIEKHLGPRLWRSECILCMRKTGDQRKDSIVKRELFEQHIQGKFNVEFVIDDRQQVVDMWRNELGLTVFQCAPGDF